ncbi:MAG: hypothetical protein JKX83_06130 [Pseudomonadales bacterium]|nr:hypothetical protein [Pseudomonadales bacterium]
MSKLINTQVDTLCFHELNPTGAVFDGNPQPIVNTINEFQAILDGGDKHLLALDYSRQASVMQYADLKKQSNVALLGDIAYYYLRYVEEIININKNVRFVCIKRDRTETVNSWLKKSSINRWFSLRIADWLKSIITRTPYHKSKNFWQEHDGQTWKLDPVWDSTFPNFEADSKEEAIGKYWDDYYEEATRLESIYPDYFRIFDISKMSNRDGQKEILSFVGIDEQQMVLKDDFHMHKSG